MSKKLTQPILFNSSEGNSYSFLSNFYLSPFKLGQYTYKTNEHYFQSKKFKGREQQLEVIGSETPKMAKKLGRKYKISSKAKWEDIKQSVMICGLRAKFMQNQELKLQLLDTGNREIRQHMARDKYWGDGGVKFNGKNRLGVLLMQVRNQLLAKSNKKVSNVV